ncbi:MAG: hypothetical protein U1F16_10035 [Turneriella sp.]
MRSVINNIADRNYFFLGAHEDQYHQERRDTRHRPCAVGFASRTGWHIVDMERIYLSPEGKPVTLDDPNLEFKPRGVRIWFRTEDDRELRSLTYIEQYLDAESVAPEYPLTKFLKQKRSAHGHESRRLPDAQ